MSDQGANDSLWGGRFSEATDSFVQRFTASVSFDQRMAQQDIRYYLNGLMLEPVNGVLRAVATDGHRLAMCEIEADTGDSGGEQVIVPRRDISDVTPFSSRRTRPRYSRARASRGKPWARIASIGS